MLRLAPWRRAPLLLLRRPGVVLALAAAAFVATLPAAAAPLFLSGARNATLHNQMAQACPWGVGMHATSSLDFHLPHADLPPEFDARKVLAHREEELVRLAPAGLKPPLHTVYFTTDASAGGRPGVPAHVLNRPDFAEHVEVLAGGSGPGVWVPSQFAAQADVKVGDTLVLPGRERRFSEQTVKLPPVTLPVAAIYTDLRERVDDGYWCSVRTLYEGQPGQEFSNTPIPVLLLVDRATFLSAGEAQEHGATHVIDFAVSDPRMTYPEADRLVAGSVRMRQTIGDDPMMGAWTLRAGSVLSDYVNRAELVRRGLLPPVVPITAAGVAVGLLVVGAAALFWVQRRRRELTVLAAHGVGSAALGVKALAEALPALAVGAVAGWYSAYALVRWVGPSDVLSPDAVPRSIQAAVAALVVAAAVVAVAAAVRCRSLTDVVRPHGRIRLLALPWELLLVAAGVALWQTLDASRELTSDSSGAVARVPAKLLIVPILVIVGVAALCSRLAIRWVRRRPPTRVPRRPSLFLAARRLRREASVAALLAAATAVPIAFAGYGATVNGSVRATLAAEARFIIGADVVLTLSERVPVPPSLAGRATEVRRLGSAIVGGIQTDVLFIDPATFARDAFWHDRASGRSLAELMGPLRRGGAVGADPVRAGQQAIVWGGQELARLDVTTVPLLPAQQGGYPVLLVTADAAPRLAERATTQLWVRGDPAEVRRAAVDAGLPLRRIQVADELYANTLFEPLTYTFDYLSALSLLTGLITTVGLLLYLESRAPVHRRGYALLRRMRLRPGAHRTALAVELTAPLLAGLAGGVVLAALIAAQLFPEFEINPALPPGTVVDVPLRAVVGTAVAVAVIALLAVTYAQRRVGRATPAEVLRDVAG
jgi:putative ABC transport system permease protein